MKPPQPLQQVADVLNVLAHPLRLRLILLLDELGTAHVSQLIARVKAEQSLVSHHLIKMKTKGVVTTQRQGKQIVYSLVDASIAQLIKELTHTAL